MYRSVFENVHAADVGRAERLADPLHDVWFAVRVAEIGGEAHARTLGVMTGEVSARGRCHGAPLDRSAWIAAPSSVATSSNLSTSGASVRKFTMQARNA